MAGHYPHNAYSYSVTPIGIKFCCHPKKSILATSLGRGSKSRGKNIHNTMMNFFMDRLHLNPKKIPVQRRSPPFTYLENPRVRMSSSRPPHHLDKKLNFYLYFLSFFVICILYLCISMKLSFVLSLYVPCKRPPLCE